MHGQKRWGKRTMEGSIDLDGVILRWQILSEPQFTSTLLWKGLCISVQAEDENHRELILEYPYPRNKVGSLLPPPQRPSFSVKTVKADVREAIALGWDPNSRGKTFTYQVPTDPTADRKIPATYKKS